MTQIRVLFPLLTAALCVLGGCASPLGIHEESFRRSVHAKPLDPSPGEAPTQHLDAEPLQGLTVSGARDRALLRNHTASAAAAAVEAARARISEARAAFLPTLTGSIEREAQEEVTIVSIPGGGSFPLSPFARTTGAAQLVIPLFAFGRDWESVQAARADLSTQLLDERGVRQQLLFEVTQAWYRIHEADAQLVVAQDQLEAVERQLVDAHNIVEAGRATADAELTAKVEVLQARQDLLVARNGTIHARRVLNALLVRELDAPIELAQPDPFAPVQLSAARLVPLAKSYNPAILAFRTQRLALEHRRESLERSWLPEFNGALGATYSDFRSATGYSTNYTASVGAQWTPINAGRRIGGLQEVHANLVALRERELDALQKLELTVQRAILDIAEAESAVALAEQSIQAAAENYRIISERFRNGKVTAREVLDAQTTLSDSRFAKNRARFGHATLLASLETQIGVAWEDWASADSAPESRP